MASKKQKQDLIDILKFEPTQVKLCIYGYGGEAYAGIVDRKIYDYFKEHKIDIENYSYDGDNQVPEEFQPFSPGCPYECDNLFHDFGAELSDSSIITIETLDGDKKIWEQPADYSSLEKKLVKVKESSSVDFFDLDVGTVIFEGGQGEKGCFFEAEFTLTAPFKPEKLTIFYANCNDRYLISAVTYDGEELEGNGGSDTNGKWAKNNWVIVGDEEVYDPDEDDEE